MMQKEGNRNISRRSFMGATASTAFAFSIVHGKVMGNEKPSNKLNLAIIGAGGQGGYSLKNTTSENLVAIADVDKVRSANAVRNNPKASAQIKHCLIAAILSRLTFPASRSVQL